METRRQFLFSATKKVAGTLFPLLRDAYRTRPWPTRIRLPFLFNMSVRKFKTALGTPAQTCTAIAFRTEKDRRDIFIHKSIPFAVNDGKQKPPSLRNAKVA
ncbi:MAG: hypothetical protein Greene041679_63 [Parcubacteria group bacterium Greene0416_79]|nr:MAG: hypothetical protein Greene041679_63 [Parcubacteria group bacterium Greene0416_79]